MTPMNDVFDIIALLLFGVILVITVQVVVTLGSLPGKTARDRGHPHADAINIASWLGIGTLVLGAVLTGPDARIFTTVGALWPLSLVWAFLKPVAAGPPLTEPQSDTGQRPGGEGVTS